MDISLVVTAGCRLEQKRLLLMRGRVHAGGAAPGQRSMAVLCLSVPSWESTNRPPARQSYPEGEGDATDISSAYYHPTGVPAHPVAEPEPLCAARQPVCMARSYSGRSPSRAGAG